MAQSNSASGTLENSGNVDIVARSNGKQITQYAHAQGNRVVTLTESSVVRIHGDSAMVASYERQGNDLIVHMKDGSTMRYQRFFFIDEHGEHSELVFDDGKTTHHAIFPFADMAGSSTAQAVIPTYQTLGDGITTLVGHEGISAGVIGGVLGALAIGGGIALAAGGGGGGHGNSNSGDGSGNGNGGNGNGNGGGNGNGNGGNGNGSGNGGGTTTPTLKLNAFAGDNVLNRAESLLNQLLSGTTQATNAGRTVTLTLNGKTYTGVVNADGTWSISVPSADLKQLQQGSHDLTVSLTDKNGHTVTVHESFDVKTVNPNLTLSPFAGDNVLSKAESLHDQLLSGTTQATNAGRTVTLTLNGKTYIGVVHADGTWSISVPSTDLKLLQQGAQDLSVSITDKYGNTVTVHESFDVKTSSPSLTISPFTGDDKLNGSELKTDQILSGSSLNLETGRVITVTLGGKSYTTQVQSDGTWKVTIPAGDLMLLAQGNSQITVSATDLAGQKATDSHTINVDSSAGGISIAILAGDNILNAQESGKDLLVRGTTSNVLAGQTVTVTLNGKTYTAKVDAQGNWNTTIPTADLKALPNDGNYLLKASVSDQNHNTVTDQENLLVVTHHLPQPTLNPPFGDGYLNGSEAQKDQTLSGTTGSKGPGQTVIVTIGGKEYTGSVDENGNWSVTVPAGDLQHLPAGTVPINVNVTDQAGNPGSTQANSTVDTTPPVLNVAPFAGDNVLSASEAGKAQIVSGQTTPDEKGQTVTVSFNGKNYTAIVDANGHWQLSIPSSDLSGLNDGNYPLVATVKDPAGNVTTVTTDVEVKESKPTISVAVFASDDKLDGAEAQVSQTVSGKTTHVEAGRTVTVTLDGGKTYLATVNADGSWKVTVPSGDLVGLANGSHSFTASVSDNAGQSATASHNFTSAADQSGIAISIISTDDYINAQELLQPLAISGTTSGVSAGAIVKVEFNGKTYNATVGISGGWTISVPTADLAGLTDGAKSVTATATDSLGHAVSTTHSVNVLAHTLPSPTINPPFGDGILNLQESGQIQVLKGTTGISGSPQTVSVTLGDKVYVAQVDAKGNWSVSVPVNDLHSFPNGNLTYTVSATDVAGNNSVLNGSALVDITPPMLSVLAFTADNILNVSEQQKTQLVSGTASTTEQGKLVDVVINGKHYSATVGLDGRWSVGVPANDLMKLTNGSYTINATLTDSAGNTTSTNHTFTVKTLLPTIAVSPFTGDGKLDAAEEKTAQILKGTTTNAEAGSLVTVTLNGHTYTTHVLSDGSWSLTIPSADLAKLAEGNVVGQVSVTDLANQTNTGSFNFTVSTDAAQGGIAIAIVSTDDYLNASEAKGPLTISGTTNNVAVGTLVTVVLNGKTYSASVLADGTWQTSVNSADLQALKDGVTKITASVSDNAGNTVNASHDLNVLIHTLPHPTISTPFGDGVLNQVESQNPQTVTGNTGVAGTGQTVSLSIGGHTYQGVVDSSGGWKVTIPAADLQALTNGSAQISVTVGDIAGNQANVSVVASVDTVSPVLTIDPFTGDNRLNIQEAKTAETLSGTAVGAEQGQTVTVTLNGKMYTTQVNGSGNWSVSIPASDLQALHNGTATINVSVADKAGNSASLQQNITVDSDPNNAPLLSVNVFAGNDVVDSGEQQHPQTLTGKTVNVEQGQTVTVTLGAGSYSGTVNADGSWSVTIPQSALNGLNDGSYTLTVKVSDLSGNSVQTTHNFSVDTAASVVTVSPITGDNLVNISEIASGLALSGTSSNIPVGGTLEITLNGKVYTTTIQANGVWNFTVPVQDAKAIPDGTSTVTLAVLDNAGNPVSSSQNFEIITHTSPHVTLNTPFGDGYLNAVEATNNQVLSGSTGVSGIGQTVTVNFGGKSYTATVDAQGNWKANIPSSDFANLNDGQQAITVTASDAVGNSDVLNGSAQIDKTLPQITIDPIAGDNIINAAEAQSPIVVSGTAPISDSGQSVLLKVVVNGSTYTATVNADGTWSITLPAGALNGVNDGNINFTASLTDMAGNTGTTSQTVKLDASAANQPTIHIDTVSGDDYINAQEANGALTISGTTTHVELNQQVTITLNGKVYTANVNADGTWSYTVPASDVKLLPDGLDSINVSVSDTSGNPATDTHNVTVIAQPADLPTIHVNTVAGDNVINAQEANSPLQITGTTSHVTAGQTVTVTLNGKTYTAKVDASGQWSTTVPQADVQALGQGTQTVSATVKDVAQNVVTDNHPIQVDTLSPLLTIDVFASDNILNYAESLVTQILSGKTESGLTVSVTVNGKTVQVTADNNGVWQLPIAAVDLQALPDGKNTISVVVTDTAGNVTNKDLSINVGTHLLPTLTLNTPFTDGILSIAESAAGGVLNGKATNLLAGTIVTVTVGSVTLKGSVDANGNWSIPVNGHVLDVLADGKATLTVSASDAYGNSSSVSTTLDVLTHQLPDATITLPLFGDGILNNAEAGLGQTLTGLSGLTGAGQTVTITLDGKSYTGSVDVNGNWSVQLPSNVLLALGDSSHAISVTLTDRAGNSDTSDVVGFTSKVTLPIPTLNTPFGDGILNALEAQSNGSLSGTSGLSTNVGVTVIVNVNGTPLAATVNADGSWTLPLSSAVLQSLPDGVWPVTVTVTDSAQNVVTSAPQNIEILTHLLPTPTILQPFGDGLLSIAEAGAAQILTGTTGITGAGQIVKVTVGTQILTATVQDNGQWTVTAPTGALSTIANGAGKIHVQVTDHAGNSVGVDGNFTAMLTPPNPTINLPFGDGNLSIGEANDVALLSGTTGLTGANQLVKISIDIGGVVYTGSVDINGNWLVSIPPKSLLDIGNGNHTISVTAQDAAGNSTTLTPAPVFHAFLTPPTVTLDTPFGDGALNVNDALSAQVLKGSLDLHGSTVASSSVVVTINGVPHDATISADGTSWSLTLQPTDLTAANLGSGNQTISVVVSDQAHNTSSTSGQALIALTLPTIVVNANFASDGVVDFGDLHASQTISGTSTGLSVGQNVSIAIGGKTFLAQVKADGSWSYNLGIADLASLASGPGTLVVSANDAANNHVDSLTTSFTLNPASIIPILTVDPVGGDNLMGIADLSTANITITGHSINIAPGSPVSVSLDVLGPYLGIINADGSWSVTIPRSEFTDGPHVITAVSLGESGAVNFTVDTVAPVLTVNAFAGDDKLNATEATTAQILSGTASGSEVGQNVQIQLNGKNYAATVISDGGSGGTWSVSVPAADLALLNQGNNDITVTLTDKAGNSTQVTHPVNVDTVIPLVSIDPLSIGGLLNTVTLGAGMLLSGHAEANSNITIKIGPLTETVQTNSSGIWSLTVPKIDLQSLTDGPQVISVTSTDAYGNVSKPVNVGLNVALNPGLGDTINTLIGGNGVLNLAESLLTQTLTGTASGNYTGAKVSVDIFGHPFTANVGSDGKWSLNIDPSAWLSAAGSSVVLDVVLTDANGNVKHTPVNLDLALTNLPIIQNVVAMGDGFLNKAESTTSGVISGLLGNSVVAGTTVTVQLGTKTYTATLTGNSWSASIPQVDLAALQDGNVKVVITATDPAGNVVTSNSLLDVIVNNLPTLSFNPLFGDGTLSLSELLAGGLSIGGSSSGLAGQTLAVSIAGSPAVNVKVGSDGKWSLALTPDLVGILQGIGSGNVTVEVTGKDIAGNPIDQTAGLKLDLLPPVLSNISLFGDGLLNAVDATTNQLITGTATGAPLGSTVSVVVGGKTFTGVTLADGSFSITLTPANLSQLPDGSLTATVTVTTPTGNTSSATAGVKVGLTNLPTIALNALFGGDGYLNHVESLVNQTISGKVTNMTSGSVNINVGGTLLTATINADGTWSQVISSSVLSNLPDGKLNISVSVTDSVGNIITQPSILTTLTHALPSISIGSLFGDGALSVGDLLSAQVISGTSVNLAGGSLSLTLGGKAYSIPVDNNGAWSLSVPPLDLKALLDGNLTVSVTAKDVAGNPASASGLLSVITHALPTLAIGSIFGDGGLNIGDLASAQVISGTSTNAQGSQLTVTLGGKSYLTTVGSDGSWSISVPQTDLSLLGDGNLGVNVSLTNPIGNTVSTGGSLNVITHLPTVGIASGLFGSDGVLNIAESGVSQLLSGTVSSALPGAKVVVTLGAVDYQATVNTNGTWSLNLSPTLLKTLTDGNLHIGVKVTDVVGNTNSTAVDVGVKLTQPILTMAALALPSLTDLLFGGKLVVIKGTAGNLKQGDNVHVSLLNDTLAADAKVDGQGNWSASLTLTLDLLNLLLLNKVVNLSAHDYAGNGVSVNVGLDGHIIDITPTSAPAPMMMAMSLDDVDTSQSSTQDHLSQSLSSPSGDESVTTPSSGTFTIGGVTIDLADGTHNSGASVTGSTANDTVHVTDLGFTHIDGGSGTDTLVLNGSNINLDLTSLGMKVEHIEIFDLGKAGNNTITLDLKEALKVTDKPEDDLLIKGSVGDRVNLVHGQGDIWDVSGQREVNGVTYDVYHNSSTGSSTLGDVLIQQGLHVNLM